VCVRERVAKTAPYRAPLSPFIGTRTVTVCVVLRLKQFCDVRPLFEL
jgi:hypothetical protein